MSPFFVRLTLGCVLLAVAGCSPEPDSIVDRSYVSPLLSAAAITPPIVDTDTIFVGTDRLPDDELTITVTAFVVSIQNGHTPPLDLYIRAEDPSTEGLTVTGAFRDDGVLPDSVAGDGAYAGTFDIAVRRSVVGTCLIRIEGMDGAGLLANSLVMPWTLVRSNLPPVLVDVLADSSVSLSSGATSLLLRARVADPNGLADIRRVWFDSFLPSGSPSSGNPFLLHDDGAVGGISGDSTAGDGTYSLRVQFQGAGLGQYRFEFKASDRSLDTSNTIIHRLTVVP